MNEFIEECFLFSNLYSLNIHLIERCVCIYIYIHTVARVIPKTQKMVLDAALLNTQHY